MAPPPKTLSIPTSLSNTKKLLRDKQTVTSKKEIVATEEEPLENPKEGPKNQVSQELLDDLFPKIKAKFKSENKNLELAILNQPLKLDGTEVPLEVMGHVQEEIAQKLIPELVQMIREQGKVDRISFRIEIKEEMEATKERLYTNSEKLNFLKKKHPALGEFQRRFGLETDF